MFKCVSMTLVPVVLVSDASYNRFEINGVMLREPMMLTDWVAPWREGMHIHESIIACTLLSLCVLIFGGYRLLKCIFFSCGTEMSSTNHILLKFSCSLQSILWPPYQMISYKPL